MAKNSFADPGGDLRKYFAAIPNIVFTLGLSPYELTLYAHFKQAAGDKGGVCWKSRATIGRESGMSAGMVTKARIALEKRRPEIGGKPLILVSEEASKTGGKTTCRVTVTDIWPENMAKYSTSYSDGATDSTSPHDGQRHTVTLATSPHDHKEELLEEKLPKKKGGDFVSELKANPLYARLNLDVEFAKAEVWADAHQKRATKRFFVNWLSRSLERLPKENTRDVWAGALTMKDLEARVRA